MLAKLERWVTRALEGTIVACLSVMAALVFGNVVLRYAFNTGIAVSEELSRLLFVWLIFMGAVLASAQRIHIGFDTLLHVVGPRVRRLLLLFTGLLLLAGCVIFIVGGWRQTQINLANSYPVLGISYAWLYGVGLVFGVALLFPVCSNLLRAWRGEEGELTEDLGAQIEAEARRVAAEADAEPRP